MTEYVGGIRSRLVWDSLYFLIKDSLTSLGWFATGRAHQPIVIQAKPVDDDVQIPINTLTVVGENRVSQDIELGSILAEHTWTFWVDFYAEDDVLGLHLISDVEDLLQGRMASIGRVGPVLHVFDYTMATPAEIFACELDTFERHRARIGTGNSRRSWYSIAFDVIDTYSGES